MAGQHIFRMPVVLELIFSNIDDDDLRQFRLVNKLWRDTATRILHQRGKKLSMSAGWVAATIERLKNSKLLLSRPPNYIIQQACIHGHLQTAQWVTDLYSIEQEEMQRMEIDYILTPPHNRWLYDYSPMAGACKHNRLEVVKWLATQHNIPFHNIYLEFATSLPILNWLYEHYNMSGYDLYTPAMLPTTCLRGNLQKVQWVSEKLEGYIGLQFHPAREALQEACQGGDIAVVDWLITKYNLGPQDAEYGGFHVLHRSCFNRTPNMAKWIVDRLQIVEVSRNCLENTLHTAAIHSNVETVKWLTERFEMTAEIARAEDNLILRSAHDACSLTALKWVADHFELTAEDARANDNEALEQACAAHTPKGLKVAQWLVNRFNLTTEDLLSNAGNILISACKGSHSQKVVQWAVEKFDLAAENIYQPRFGPQSVYDQCTDKELKRWLDNRFRADRG